MARFKEYDRPQGLFLTVNLEEQLLPGTSEWTLDCLIDKMDMPLFEKNYNNDETGAKAYPPGVLLKIIIYSCSLGIVSSRPIERARGTNIILRAPAEDAEPDHDTIATFISTNNEAASDLFTQVVIQCGELGLITGEMFALDGCKLPSNAGKEWPGKPEDLRKKKADLQKLADRIIRRHREPDKSGSAKKKRRPFKKTMGDDRERRKRRIERVEKKLERINKFLETAQPKKGAGGAEIKSNITDNESAFIMGPRGYIQGYNGIAAADSGNQVIIAAEAAGSGPEGNSLPRMLDSLNENMKTITGKKEPLKRALATADTGYFCEDNLREAAGRNIPVLIPDAYFRKRDPCFDGRKNHASKQYTSKDFIFSRRGNYFTCPAGEKLTRQCGVTVRNTIMPQYKPHRGVCGNVKKCINARNGKNPRRTLYVKGKPHEENLSERMRNKIDDAAYRELYSRRMQIIEPVFSNMTYNKGMNRFTMRTQIKVNIQWLLYCIVHNIGKCVRPLELKYG